MASSLLSSSTSLSPLPCPRLSPSPHRPLSSRTVNRTPCIRIRAAASATPEKEEEKKIVKRPPKKPVYSMKKGQIVRVDKEKYLNSVNYLSVGHPPNYKGLDYIYEDRGEVLDIRIIDTGEYALIAWVGIPTAPAWLPTDMLHKAEKLDYERV